MARFHRRKFTGMSTPGLTEKVIWASEDIGDGLGYDIEAVDEQIEKRSADKAKGRPLSRDDRPSLRFFEDLVRIPGHNKVIPKSVVSRKLGPPSL
jgi:hypothetical protein